MITAPGKRTRPRRRSSRRDPTGAVRIGGMLWAQMMAMLTEGGEPVRLVLEVEDPDEPGFLHPEVTRPFLGRIGLMAQEAMSRDRLTDRKQSVLQELAEGKSTREIAKTLVVAEETVKSDLAHIYQKLGVNDRVHTVAVALRPQPRPVTGEPTAPMRRVIPPEGRQ